MKSMIKAYQIEISNGILHLKEYAIRVEATRR